MSESRKVNILLFEPNPLCRDGVKHSLERSIPDCEVFARHNFDGAQRILENKDIEIDYAIIALNILSAFHKSELTNQDGFRLYSELKDIPFCLVSPFEGEPAKEYLKKGLGVSDFDDINIRVFKQGILSSHKIAEHIILALKTKGFKFPKLDASKDAKPDEDCIPF